MLARFFGSADDQTGRRLAFVGLGVSAATVSYYGVRLWRRSRAKAEEAKTAAADAPAAGATEAEAREQRKKKSAATWRCVRRARARLDVPAVAANNYGAAP